MNIFLIHTVSLFLIFILASPASTTKSQPSPTGSPDNKRLKTSSSNKKAQNKDPNSKDEEKPKITEIPQKVLDFFNEAEFSTEARLDSPDSYVQSNADPFKKLFFGKSI